MAIDWEGLLGASGPGLQRAYDDCIQEALERMDELSGLEHPGFSAGTYEEEWPFGDPREDYYRDIDEPEEGES